MVGLNHLGTWKKRSLKDSGLFRPNLHTPMREALRGRFCTALIITLLIPGTPLNTTHLQEHA